MKDSTSHVHEPVIDHSRAGNVDWTERNWKQEIPLKRVSKNSCKLHRVVKGRKKKPRILVQRPLSIVRFAMGYRSPYGTLSVIWSYFQPLGSIAKICQHISFPTESSREAGLWLEATSTALGRQMNELGVGSSPASSPCLCAPTPVGQRYPLLFSDKPSPHPLPRVHSACTGKHTTPSLLIVETWKNKR